MSHEKLAPGHYHHFEPEQAYHSSKLGMWFFLATEIHLFTALFAVFFTLRGKYLDSPMAVADGSPADVCRTFNECAQTLYWQLGMLNTALLLISSYVMVLAVDAAQHGQNKKCWKYLFITNIFALGFCAVKCVEYYGKFSHGIGPWTNSFYGLYFTMTGIHALHVIIGMGVIIWLMRLSKRGTFSTSFYTPVEVVGLYWHLVDAVWIFLFPLVYLLGGIN